MLLLLGHLAPNPNVDEIDDAEQDDSNDEWPMFVRGTTSEGAQLELRLHADDAEITPPDDRTDATPRRRDRPMMDALGIGGGALAPVGGNSVLESYRQRDPRRGREEVLPYRV